jgi:hypothetical protein
MPLPGIAMVPVGLVGTGLVPDDVISVAPKGIPVPPTDAPFVASSGEVVLTEGVGITIPCATAALPARSSTTAAKIVRNLTCALPAGFELIDAVTRPLRSRRRPKD